VIPERIICVSRSITVQVYARDTQIPTVYSPWATKLYTMAPDIFGIIITVHVLTTKIVCRPLSLHAWTKQKLQIRGRFAGHCSTVDYRDGKLLRCHHSGARKSAGGGSLDFCKTCRGGPPRSIQVLLVLSFTFRRAL